MQADGNGPLEGKFNDTKERWFKCDSSFSWKEEMEVIAWKQEPVLGALRVRSM